MALLTQLIPAINREFGLTPDQIEELNPRMKVLVYKAIVAFGGAMVGRLITRDLILQALAEGRACASPPRRPRGSCRSPGRRSRRA